MKQHPLAKIASIAALLLLSACGTETDTDGIVENDNGSAIAGGSQDIDWLPAGLSREIGVSDGTLNNWRNQYRDRGNAVPADPSNSESRGGAGVKRRSTLGGGYVEDGHLESSDRPYRNRVVSGNETPESSAAFERMMDLDNC